MSTAMPLPLGTISHVTAGRAQMGMALSFHVFFAVLGVGLPLVMLVAEGMHLRTGDPVWRALARRWSKVFAVLFAVGTANPRQPVAETKPRRSRRLILCGACVAVTITLLTVPASTGVPARLIDGCAKWIAIAGAFQLLSAVGFIVLFKLVFGAGQRWRQSTGVGLRSLAASTVLPAGGLVGPVAGSWSTASRDCRLARLTRCSVAFVVLTNLPALLIMATLGTMLWLGWPAGSHVPGLTLAPAGAAVLAVAVGWRLREKLPTEYAEGSRRRGALRRGGGAPVRLLRCGVVDAHRLISAHDWKLAGAFAYYAFDNAVLWAAFHAYGRTPPLPTIVMGYVIGSLGGALPTPAGLGGVEGGMIGALVLYGVRAPQAVAAVLLYRAVTLSVPLMLGAVAWLWTPARELASKLRGARRRSPQPTMTRSIMRHSR